MKKDLDLQPTLRGQWVILRPIEPSDFDELYQAASDPLIWEQHPEPTRYQRDVFQVFFDGAISCKSGFVVLNAKTGKIIGSTRFHGYDPEKSVITIGYTFLERAYWGKEYNPEMKKLLLDYVFTKVERAHFYIGEKNIRSRRAIESVGGKLVDEARRTLPNGSIHVDVIYEIKK